MTQPSALPTCADGRALPADWRDLLALTKPRVMSLVVFTGLCGLLAAPVPIHPVLGFTAILCIALGAGAAGALNQWYEADLDAQMKRTASRPLPAGRMDRQTALHFGVGLGVFSVLLMGLADQLARRRDPGRLDPVLRARLHRLAEAADAAEHRHRRRRRRLPAADRLGRGDRRRRAAAAAAVRDHLPVDAAAFLGAVAVRPLRLCRRRRADAAGGRRARRRPAGRSLLYTPADGRGGGRALAARPRRARSTASPPSALSARLPAPGAGWCSPTARPSRPGWRPEKRLFAFSILYLFALFARWSPTGGSAA